MTSELAETNASKEWMPRAVGMLASWTMLPMLTRYSIQWNLMELNLLSIWRQLEFYLFIIIIIIFIHEYYYGGAVALLLQDHLTMSVSRFAV